MIDGPQITQIKEHFFDGTVPVVRRPYHDIYLVPKILVTAIQLITRKQNFAL